MDQVNHGESYGSPSVQPVKRGRGRPRKQSSIKTDDSLVGQPVTGVIEATFGVGYLLTVKIRNSNISLRGVVFKPGEYVPITTANDVAPHIQMIQINDVSHSRPRSKRKFGQPKTDSSVPVVGALGTVVPVVLEPVNVQNGSLPTPDASQTCMFDFGDNHVLMVEPISMLPPSHFTPAGQIFADQSIHQIPLADIQSINGSVNEGTYGIGQMDKSKDIMAKEINSSGFWQLSGSKTNSKEASPETPDASQTSMFDFGDNHVLMVEPISMLPPSHFTPVGQIFADQSIHQIPLADIQSVNGSVNEGTYGIGQMDKSKDIMATEINSSGFWQLSGSKTNSKEASPETPDASQTCMFDFGDNHVLMVEPISMLPPSHFTPVGQIFADQSIHQIPLADIQSINGSVNEGTYDIGQMDKSKDIMAKEINSSGFSQFSGSKTNSKEASRETPDASQTSMFDFGDNHVLMVEPISMLPPSHFTPAGQIFADQSIHQIPLADIQSINGSVNEGTYEVGQIEKSKDIMAKEINSSGFSQLSGSKTNNKEASPETPDASQTSMFDFGGNHVLMVEPISMLPPSHFTPASQIFAEQSIHQIPLADIQSINGSVHEGTYEIGQMDKSKDIMAKEINSSGFLQLSSSKTNNKEASPETPDASRTSMFDFGDNRVLMVEPISMLPPSHFTPAGQIFADQSILQIPLADIQSINGSVNEGTYEIGQMDKSKDIMAKEINSSGFSQLSGSKTNSKEASPEDSGVSSNHEIGNTREQLSIDFSEGASITKPLFSYGSRKMIDILQAVQESVKDNKGQIAEQQPTIASDYGFFDVTPAETDQTNEANIP